MQQRGIPPLIVDWLQKYGAYHHVRDGAVSRFFDKKSRRDLQRAVGKEIVKRTNDLLDCYLIEKDNQIVTVAKRYKRAKFD